MFSIFIIINIYVFTAPDQLFGIKGDMRAIKKVVSVNKMFKITKGEIIYTLKRQLTRLFKVPKYDS